MATLDVYQEEGIFERVARMAGKWEAAIHDIRSAGGVVRDIRNLGLLGAVEIEAAPNAPGQRARAVANHCLENGIFIRAVGDTLILSSPLIISEEQISQIADGIRNGIRTV
ncbi:MULTISPECIES: aminotransferase class III-fold pyridoxal phosphate-dependent enzyme [unclassified Bradyrhizobium]|uniref:aminotransferase class III-fold pyridoxal phosphate-dependent enzyme n=1 Tax=unclassified Bradyrhizobium TaxID=2631580 RepID=UPI0024B0BE6E|nr:aminotransferase class III-fold pyridoxal phosphate-dependent enzyme [Bradyrhizobium sp. CB2312]WFU76949.1 aminotransferase class III-fold pyridoxal phosphate-dependent enzyme [Bradyrhizobium sp. CB2312]